MKLKFDNDLSGSSSEGGGGYNELRFEDLAGQEEIWLKAERDWDTLVQRDHRRLVKNNETQEVEVDRARRVGQDERVAIGRDRTHEVANDEVLAVGKDRSKVVNANERDVKLKRPMRTKPPKSTSP